VLIREFLCIHEYGTVVYHRKYQHHGESTDIILRSGLISALYNFAAETEKDSIDFLRMEKVQLFFKKKELLLFVLFIDSSINPNLVKTCEFNFNLLQKTFFKRFPEIQWQREIINLAVFESFNKDADQILSAFGKKLDLLKFLNDDGLVLEKDFVGMNIGSLGSKVGKKILERNHDHLAHALTQNTEFALKEIDNILALLNGANIERSDYNYILNCAFCYLCDNEETECFFKELLTTIFVSLNLDSKITMNILKK
jgi:hypothetical protein